MVGTKGIRKMKVGAFSERPPSPWGKSARAAAVKQAHDNLFSTTAPAHAWTLTCRQTRFNAAGGLVHLDRDMLSKALRQVLRRIDRAVYKKGARRFGKQLGRFCTIEGGPGTGQHLHANLLIECPSKYMSWWEFSRLVRQEWQKSEWGASNNRFDPAPDEMETLHYFTKYGPETIDWQNTAWPEKESG